ncbi:SERTA domain-containing protein 3 isoform 4-T5 [Glossophaga mutica]
MGCDRSGTVCREKLLAGLQWRQPRPPASALGTPGARPPLVAQTHPPRERGIMVGGGLKRKHSDLEEEEEDEKCGWGPAGLRSYQQALLRISLDKVQRSLGPRAPSLRRHVLIHNTLQQLQAALCLAPAPALPPEPLFLGFHKLSCMYMCIWLPHPSVKFLLLL